MISYDGGNRVRRVLSCIGFDEDNIEWLRHRPEGMADFLNGIVAVYRNHDDIRKMIDLATQTKVMGSDNLQEKLEKLKAEEVDNEVKIKAYFEDHPEIVYMAKIIRRPTKADICKIKDNLYFSKYAVDVRVEVIKKVLRECVKTFDDKKYEKERDMKR